MNQKQRNKIAWGLAIVLVPLLIYLIVTGLAGIRQMPPPPEPAAVADTGQVDTTGAKAEPPPVQPSMQPAAPVAPKILAEQRRIAMLLPKSNPFNPLRAAAADAPPLTVAPAAALPAAAADPSLKLTAIISRQGGSARAAMINGRLFGEGDHIANWTIIKVTAREVLLKDGARQMTLRLK